MKKKRKFTVGIDPIDALVVHALDLARLQNKMPSLINQALSCYLRTEEGESTLALLSAEAKGRAQALTDSAGSVQRGPGRPSLQHAVQTVDVAEKPATTQQSVQPAAKVRGGLNELGFGKRQS